MSGYTTRYDTVTLGEPGVLITPHRPDPVLPGVVYVHGSNDDATYPIRDSGSITGLMRRLTERGHRGVSGDFAGKFTWANPANQAAITHAADVLMGVGGRVVLVAGSMGAAAALVWATHHRARVACVVAHLPVCDIDDIHAANRWGVAPAIDAAYTGGWSQAVYGADHNPVTLAQAGALTGLPILLHVAELDDIALAERAAALAAAVGPTAQVRLIPGGGHDVPTYARIDPDDSARFIAEHTP